MNNIVLSICIPTYNRINRLRNTLDGLLKCRDKRFNVVISDNNSTDGTKDYLDSLRENKKICFVSHDHDISPAYNGFTSIEGAQGLFSLFLLDKDFVNVEYLPTLLDELEKGACEFGYCDLGRINNNEMEYLLQGYESITKLAYLCKHPSGYFFRTDIIKSELLKCSYLADVNFPFSLDVICTHLAIKYNALIVHFPIIGTETASEAARVKSLSYNNENLWFAPKQVVQRFCVFLEDLSSLSLPPTEKRNMYINLIRRCLDTATVQYAGIMTNEMVCAHYGLYKQRLSLFHLLNISLNALKELKEKLDMKSHINRWNELSILFKNYCSVILYKLKK